MNSFLFVTNPDEYDVASVANGKAVTWSCHSKTRKGDRIFVYLVDGRGIPLEWEATSDAKRDPDWKYVCRVRLVRKMSPSISLKEIKAAFAAKEWGAAHQNFRGYTAIAIPAAVAAKLAKFRSAEESLKKTTKQPSESAQIPRYREFGEAPDDNPEDLQMFARKVRKGQSAFRKKLLQLYGGRCAISGWSPEAVLEAAHLRVHSVSGNNASKNGILLRSDLHGLFDDGLLRINPTTFEVVIDSSLMRTHYSTFNGTTLRPRTNGSQPDRKCLGSRWKPT